MTTLPFVFESRKLQHHSVVLMTPREPMLVTRERLRQIQFTNTLSDVELAMLDELRLRDARVVMFRARRDDQVMWRLDADLGDDELAAAGLQLTLGLIPFYRSLAMLGVALHFHVGWGVRECYAQREGQLAAAAKRQLEGDPFASFDAWLLRNQVHHVALSEEHVMTKLLPLHASMLDRRRDRLRRMLSRLPDSQLPMPMPA